MSRFLPLLTPLFLLLCLSLSTPATALDILALPTVMDQRLDAWQHVPVGSEPAIYPTKRVYSGQPFRLLIIGKDYATDSLQNVNISYSIQVFDPDGTPLFDPETVLELFNGHVKSNTSLLLSQQYLTLDFSESDPIGDYRFQITAHDLLAEKEATTSATITLAAFSERDDFGSTEDFSAWLENYYRAPDPARAVTALLQYVDPELLAGHKQTPLLTFLSRVIQNNPFVWPYLKSIYAESDAANRKQILLISALSGQKDDIFFSSLDPDLATFYLDALKIHLPVPASRPVTSIEIATLWAEFSATGTIEPIRKLVGALYLESTRGTQDKIAAEELEATPEAKSRAALESVYQSAIGSLLQNGDRHSLVKQYLGYIYEIENSEPVIRNQLEDILAILHKRENEEAARKHLEKEEETRSDE